MENRLEFLANYTESLFHVFHECEISVELWHNLNLAWIIQNPAVRNEEWFTWVFYNCSSSQVKQFVCGIWGIWIHRNKKVHDYISHSGKHIAE